MNITRNVLFEPTKIKKMELRNRFVRSATYDGCGDDGYVTDKQVNLYRTLSKGGVGLIITGITYVYHNGRISKFQNSIAGNEFIDGLKRLSAAEHQRGKKLLFTLRREDARIISENLGVVNKTEKDIVRDLILKQPNLRALIRNNHYEPYAQVDIEPFFKKT